MNVNTHFQMLGWLAAIAVSVVTVTSTSEASNASGYQDQLHNDRILNPLATVIMRWYGYLVTPAEHRSREASEDAARLFESADALFTYQQRYPERIRNIDILEARLDRRGPHQFVFLLETRVFYWASNHLRAAELTEAIVFVHSTAQTPKIIAIERQREVDDIAVTPSTGSDRGDVRYYQLRTVVYAWLAHMDGMADPHSQQVIAGWIDRTTYEIEFGAMTFRGDVETALHWRRGQQGRGGHLLRSLRVLKRHEAARRVTLELIIDWKGKTPDGISAIGQIRQELTIKISDRGQHEVLMIRERHLLPALKPWTRLLC